VAELEEIGIGRDQRLCLGTGGSAAMQSAILTAHRARW